LRISSQHVANWLYHGVCSEAQVRQTFARMAKIVDQQNATDPAYRPMATNLDRNIAYQAGLELVFQGCGQPNGYTEFILHSSRKLAKANGAQPLPA
jgi:malate synthase